MARMRTLKPEAATSESLAEVSRATRWTFALLWTHCDDEGRAVLNPKLIKAALYPLDDDVTADVIRDEIRELERVGAVCRYEIAGKEYLHVPSWSEHQHPNRKVDSKLPACPKTDHSAPSHTQRSEDAVSDPGGLTPVVVGEGRGDVAGEKEGRGATRTRGARLPEDWTPDQSTREWTLTQISNEQATRELEKFRNYWLAKTGKDATKLDWNLTWRNWVLKAAERAGPPGRSGSTTDDRVTAARDLAERLRAEERAQARGLSA